jgi:hypothetical protein
VKPRTISLVVDSLIILALGILLVIFSRRLAAEFLGVPIPMTPFYASLLGAVLIGIGFALLLESFKHSASISGLGLEGAITINLLGVGTLIIWLVSGNLVLPLHGTLFLSIVALLVLGTGVV